MKKIKIYQYDNCTTCRNALKFLDKNGVSYEKISITESPPSAAELKKMLAFMDGDIRKIFNTSGLVYREMGLSEKLKTMSEDQAIALLAKHGKLIKRPFLLSSSIGTVGFKEAEWKKIFS